MPLSSASQARLGGAHPVLQKLFLACASDPACPPFLVLDSQRGKAAQEKAFALGHSRAHFGQSAHNWSPAVALDVAPYPVNWTKLDRFRALAAFVKAKARKLGIQITWGGDWPGLVDMPHYEIEGWQTMVSAGKVKPYAG